MQKEEMIRWSIIGLIILVLLFNSYWDIRYREIHLWSVAGLGAIGIGYVTYGILKDGFIFAQLWGLLVAGGIVLFTILKRELIGIGDGIMMAVLSLFLIPEAYLIAIFLAAFLIGVSALFLIAIHKKHKGDTLPFIPFWTIAVVLELLGGGMR